MGDARPGRLAARDAGRHSRSAIDRRAAAAQSRTDRLRRDDLASCSRRKFGSGLQRLREEIEAGSPRPQIELTLDPLGVVAPALKPFAGNAAVDEGQPLTSPDRTMRVFLVVTNQPTSAPSIAQQLMEEVNAFRATRARELGRRPARGSRHRPLRLRRRKSRSACGTTSSSLFSARSFWSAAFSTPDSAAGCRCSGWASRFCFAASSRSPSAS